MSIFNFIKHFLLKKNKKLDNKSSCQFIIRFTSL